MYYFGDRRVNGYRVNDGIILAEKSLITRRKLDPVLLCPPKIPHELDWH